MIAGIATLSLIWASQGALTSPDWVEPLEDAMVESGLAPAPDVPCRTKARTRYDHAVFAYAATKAIEERMKGFDKEQKPNGRIEKWWLQVDGLVNMLREYRTELASMGVTNTYDLVEDLRRAQSSLAVVGAGGHAVPAWVPVAERRLRLLGVSKYQDFFNDWPKTRYDHAVLAHSIYVRVESGSADADVDNEGAARKSELRKSIADLVRLIGEFRQELTAMQVFESTTLVQIHADIAAFRTRITTLRSEKPPFPDVPAMHWAAPAIRDLKDAGLVKGYPSGRFGG